MRSSIIRRATAIAAVLALGMMGVANAEETVLTPATETLFISAGCAPDTPGTCTSTRWLGRATGDATSNYLTATTPVDEVLYRVDGAPNWRDYPSDESLRADGYPLNAGEDLQATVTLSARVIAANNTVHARIDAMTADRKVVTFGPLEVTGVTIGPNSQQEVEFAFDIPDSLDGVTLKHLTFFTAVHGVNAQGGYINQQGGSTVEIPYFIDTAATPS